MTCPRARASKIMEFASPVIRTEVRACWRIDVEAACL